VPFSSSPRVNRDDLLKLIDEALEHLPEELKRARWLLKERNEFLAKAQREADQIIEAARVQAERMVERDEVVRAARRHADALVEDAEARSRALQHEAEDYVDQRLAAFEVVLDRTMQTVQRGREQLQVHTGSPSLSEAEPTDEDEPGFFDQDN
jgi:F0F1-type ATP synthase membrane subunit b/b'